MMLIDPLLSPLRLLEVSHVAHRLSASQGFVRQLIRKKKLKAIRIGTRYRVDPVDLEAFIDKQRVDDDPPRPARRRDDAREPTLQLQGPHAVTRS